MEEYGELLGGTDTASGHTRTVVTDPRESQLENTRTKIIGKTEKIPAQNGNNISFQPKEEKSHQTMWGLLPSGSNAAAS